MKSVHNFRILTVSWVRRRYSVSREHKNWVQYLNRLVLSRANTKKLEVRCNGNCRYETWKYTCCRSYSDFDYAAAS